MGRKSSIDADTGRRLLEAYHRLGSQRAAADEQGVSWGAARRYFASVPQAAAPQVVQQEHLVRTAGGSLFDTRRVLEANHHPARTTRCVC